MRTAVVVALCISALGSPATANELDGYLTLCLSADETACKLNKDEFRRDYPKALKGDYQAQRNVSYCFASGKCEGVVQNRPLGCAWRAVILASGNPKVDSTDTGFFNAYCRGRLDEAETLQFSGQSRELFRRIYKRSM